jgi:O-antigen/teichoic acid export membrane protein
LIWRGGVIVTLVSSTLGILLFLAREEIATRLFGEPALAPLLALFAGMLPLGTLGHLLDQIVVGFQQTARSKTISSFFTYPLLIALTILFLHLGWGVHGYILATLASSAAGIIVLGRVVWQLMPATTPEPTASPSLEPAVWRYAFSMAFLGIWAFLAGEADKLILGIYLPAASVGVYSVALTIAAFIPMLLTSVNSIFAPTIANLYAKGQHALLEQLLQTLTKWIFGLTVPLIAIVLLFAPELMGIFGKDFQVGGYVLAIVALGQIANVGTGSVGMMLLMTGHQRQLIQTQITSAVAMLAFYLLLIPGWGILGAALAQAIGLVIANGLNLWHVHRRLGMLPYPRSLLKLLGPLGVTGICLLGLKLWTMPGWTDLVQLSTSLVFAYSIFGVLALWTGLDENDRVVLDAVRGRMIGLMHRLANLSNS